LRSGGAQKRSEQGRAGDIHLDRGVFSCLFSVGGLESQKRHRTLSVFDRFLTALDTLEDGQDGDGLTIVRTVLRRL